jgi:hypothetical protein
MDYTPSKKARARLRERELRDQAYREALAKNPNQQAPVGTGAAKLHQGRPRRRKFTPVEREMNVVKCPVCNAVPGEPCFVVVDGKYRLQKTTHITMAKARAAKR